MQQSGIGTNALPEHIRNSKLLSSINIALLGSVSEIPVIDPAYYDERLKNIFQYYSINPDEMDRELQLYANELLDKKAVSDAWQVLLTMP